MSFRTSHLLLSRLHRDLSELLENPYPGVAVFTDDANLRQLCLVLTPPSGPWKDLALHFDVRLPDNWPSHPPQVSSSVPYISHPNLFGSYICCDLLKTQDQLATGYTGGYTPALTLRGLFLQFLTFFSSTKVEQDYGYSVEIGDASIISYIHEVDFVQRLFAGQQACCHHHHCTCDDSKNQTKLERDWNDSTFEAEQIATYNAAGDAVGHMVKQTSEGKIHRIEKRNPRWTSTFHQISVWSCPKCPYGSQAVPHHRQETTEFRPVADSQSILFQSPPRCHLHDLNDDTLAELATHLPSESIITLSMAYPRFRNIVTSFRVLLHRELGCFFLRTSLTESILGVGVALDTKSRTLSSDFDWLSMQAFDAYNVRRSIQKRKFEFFLPLAFSRPHFERARVDIWRCLGLLNTAIVQSAGRNPNGNTVQPLRAHSTAGVLYKMMNNIVVSLMKSVDDTRKGGSNGNGNFASPTLLHASEKAIISYCHLFHLLTCLCRSTPDVLKDATVRLRTFITEPETRAKAHTPDMGELIVIITLVLVLPPIDNAAPITWPSINAFILEEAINRNVRWVLKDSPELEVLETGASDYRLNATFSSSKTSLRLMMFQVSFLNLFIKTYGAGISRLDENYGFADKELPETMVEEIKAIYEVNSWPKFFARVQYVNGTKFTKEKFSDILRKAVQTSAARHYHTPAGYRRLGELQAKRSALERYLKRSAPPR